MNIIDYLLSRQKRVKTRWQTIMQILARHKPAGMNKHFSMAVVVESLANTLDEDKQVEQKSCYFTRKPL